MDKRRFFAKILEDDSTPSREELKDGKSIYLENQSPDEKYVSLHFLARNQPLPRHLSRFSLHPLYLVPLHP